MQFITRMLIVLAVLGGLGYGSYAFGKYVLSARLFGPQGKTATTTASTGTLQAPPKVNVEVVPAPQPADASDDAPRAVTPTATPDARVEIVPSQDGIRDDNSGSTRVRERAEPTPRPRRKRRRPRPTAAPPRPNSPAPQQAPPARTQNVDPPAGGNFDSEPRTSPDNDAPRVDTPRRPAPRVETPRAEAPTPPRRERERRTVPETTEAAPRVPVAPPKPARQRETSPVPVPEGSLGGRSESPIPVPG